MVKNTNLGWIFKTDGVDGSPYIQCPHCGRRIGGISVVFAERELSECPDCEKELHFDNLTEEDWIYMDSYFGEV